MPYLLDADVLIEAQKRHYGFDICPGFWDWIVRCHDAGTILSIEKVREEIGNGNDPLVTWAAIQSNAFFVSPDALTVANFRIVSQRATGQSFSPTAVSEFLQKADYFLVAHALAHTLTVVTHERPGNSTNKIKIPDACVALGVTVIDPFQMLRREAARFVLDG